MLCVTTVADIFACLSVQVQVSCSVIDINNNLQAFTTNTVEFLNSGLVLPVSDYNNPISLVLFTCAHGHAWVLIDLRVVPLAESSINHK